MKELTTFLLLNEYCKVAYILSFLSHASEVNIQVRIGNTSFLMEVPTCSARQGLAKSLHAFSVVINEGNFGGYFKNISFFNISYSL